jgi:hypothetical protein
MAHYAEIDTNNIVVNVIAGVDENEKSGGETLYLLLSGNYWKRTSYNTHGGIHTLDGTPLRKNYAGVGFTYDPVRDAFIPPQPYPSWTLNEDTCRWDSPIPLPDDGKMYAWDEATTSYVELTDWDPSIVYIWDEAALSWVEE